MQIQDYAAPMVGVDLGPCYQIAVVADGLLCGLVGKIIARLEESCKRLWAIGSTGRASGVAWRGFD